MSASKSNGKQRRVSVLAQEQQNFLEKSLSNRPTEASIESQGIKKDGGRFAAEKAALGRALASHAIARELSDRPDADELAQQGILEQSNVAPSLAGVAKALNKAIISNSLNQKLYARESGAHAEEAEKLFKANDVAPRLRGAKVALERAFTRDAVGAKLDQRPDQSALLQSGILTSPISAKLAGVQKELQKRYTSDRIGHLLEQRSDIQTLEKEGVLKDVKVAPALQGIQRKLEHNLAKSNLFHALAARPTIQQLAEQHIWQPNPEINYYEESDSDDEDDENQYYQYAQNPILSPSSAANRAANISYASNPAQSPQTTASIAGIAAAEAAYGYYKEMAEQQAQQAYYAQQQQQQQQQPSAASYAQYAGNNSYSGADYTASAAANRRSKNFHLTRILLKFVAAMGETGELAPHEKSLLKELIVDAVPDVYYAAEQFDQDNDLYSFKAALIGFAQRR